MNCLLFNLYFENSLVRTIIIETSFKSKINNFFLYLHERYIVIISCAGTICCVTVLNINFIEWKQPLTPTKWVAMQFNKNGWQDTVGMPIFPIGMLGFQSWFYFDQFVANACPRESDDWSSIWITPAHVISWFWVSAWPCGCHRYLGNETEGGKYICLSVYLPLKLTNV